MTVLMVRERNAYRVLIIEFADKKCKRARAALLRTLNALACVSLGTGGAAAASAACDAPMSTLANEVDIYRADGRDSWPALFPLAAAARQCFEQEGMTPPPRFFAYETYLLVQTRRYAEAEATFDRFFAGPAQAAPVDLVSRMYRRRGFVEARLGRTAASLHSYVLAGALADQLPPGPAAETLLDVGERFRLLRDLHTARQYFDEAERRLAAAPPDERRALEPVLGMARMLRAWVLIEAATQGDLEEREAGRRALPLALEAVRLLPAPPDPTLRHRRALALLMLSSAQRFAGRPALALPAATEALRLADELQDTYPLLQIQALREHGEIALAQGRPAAARRAFERALAVARASAQTLDAALSLLDLGMLDEAGPRPDLRAAEQRYREAVRLNETVRGSLGTQEWSAAFFADLQMPYRSLVRLLLRQGRTAEAFVVLDGTRARHLRDLRSLSQRQGTLSTAARARLDRVAEQQQQAHATLARPGLSAARRSALNGRVIALQREVERVSGFEPAQPEPLRMGALQATLRTRGQVFLTYFFEGEDAWAFVVRPDTLVTVRLRTDEAALRTALATVGALWRPGERTSPDVDLRALHQLHDALFLPVRPFIPADARLVVVPEGVLERLPFSLLVEDEHPRFHYADAPYLLRRHPITTELAAALLLEPPPRHGAGGENLVLGRTRFGATAAASARAGGRLYPDLPNVADEVQRVRAWLPAGIVALDERATEALLNLHLADVRLLHLASHAVADPVLPLYSHVELWDDPAADDDGRLHLYELQGRRLDADLVVLSGCGTAQGRTHVGEGMLGLQHAFRAVGAQSTLATLWSVDDRATAEVMDRFYAHLRRGLPKDRALQRANIEYLAAHEGRDASPFFWAAPVLYGNPAALEWEMPLATQARWALLGLLLLAAAVALPRLQTRWRSGGPPPERAAAGAV